MRVTAAPHICAIAFLLTLAGCSSSPDQRQELVVFAAASLADALEEIEGAFEANHPYELTFAYGGSQMLAQQISGGAPADVFLSAGVPPIDFLLEIGMLKDPGTAILTNRLVLAVRETDGPRIATIQALADPQIGRIAIADPELAPAGLYARQSLERLALWDALKPKLVFGTNVRVTIAYLESGNADAAIVYFTDAVASPKVRVLDLIPPDSHEPIAYPGAIIRVSKKEQGAETLLEFLRGEEAVRVFGNYGFEVAR